MLQMESEILIADNTGARMAEMIGVLGKKNTRTAGAAQLWLGPEPIISAQQVLVVNESFPGRAVRVSTDGVRAFSVEALR